VIPHRKSPLRCEFGGGFLLVLYLSPDAHRDNTKELAIERGRLRFTGFLSCNIHKKLTQGNAHVRLCVVIVFVRLEGCSQIDLQEWALLIVEDYIRSHFVRIIEGHGVLLKIGGVLSIRIDTPKHRLKMLGFDSDDRVKVINHGYALHIGKSPSSFEAERAKSLSDDKAGKSTKRYSALSLQSRPNFD